MDTIREDMSQTEIETAFEVFGRVFAPGREIYSGTIKPQPSSLAHDSGTLSG